ncbi:caspase-1-like isoform X2 [Rhynchophorus ferrugineus]|uniref:caspase-1-like isoform X2 n=1 Tax=Rhynchophorus ferrugineus TaxID=354439 RepID=UPI003FCE678E
MDKGDGNVCNGSIHNKQIANSDERDALGRPGTSYNGYTARMPVSKDAPYYNMAHPRRGIAIIFNHEIFEYGSLKPRSGTMEDANKLQACLKNLDFDVFMYKDLKKDDIEKIIEDASKMDHSNHDCILVVTLTHGEADIVYAKDKPYKTQSLWSTFTADKCPTLAGKPKMFFFQACQGDNLDPGVDLHRDANRTETDGERHESYRIPTHADFLIVYSTANGFFSWRNTTKGSWFIQALCEELSENAFKLDLMTLLTFVSRKVATEFESNVPGNIQMHGQKQIPCIISQLTRLIKFQKSKFLPGPSNFV